MSPSPRWGRVVFDRRMPVENRVRGLASKSEPLTRQFDASASNWRPLPSGERWGSCDSPQTLAPSAWVNSRSLPLARNGRLLYSLQCCPTHGFRHDSPLSTKRDQDHACRGGRPVRLAQARPRRPERDRAPRQLRRGRHGRVRHRLAHRQQAPQARRRRRVDPIEAPADSRSGSPTCSVYQDCRELLDKEKDLNSVNVSTPDHMHAPITMSAMQRGLHVYTPEAADADDLRSPAAHRGRRREEARHPDGHSDPLARRCTRRSSRPIQDGAIGKVKEVHSWSGKYVGRHEPAARSHGPRPAGTRTGTVGSASPPNGRSSATATITRATGGSGSTSAPARSATWAATFSTPSSEPSASATRSPSAPNSPDPTTTTGRWTCR